jgi:hypothetical protein
VCTCASFSRARVVACSEEEDTCMSYEEENTRVVDVVVFSQAHVDTQQRDMCRAMRRRIHTYEEEDTYI